MVGVVSDKPKGIFDNNCLKIKGIRANGQKKQAMLAKTFV